MRPFNGPASVVVITSVVVAYIVTFLANGFGWVTYLVGAGHGDVFVSSSEVTWPVILGRVVTPVALSPLWHAAILWLVVKLWERRGGVGRFGALAAVVAAAGCLATTISAHGRSVTQWPEVVQEQPLSLLVTLPPVSSMLFTVTMFACAVRWAVAGHLVSSPASRGTGPAGGRRQVLSSVGESLVVAYAVTFAATACIGAAGLFGEGGYLGNGWERWTLELRALWVYGALGAVLGPLWHAIPLAVLFVRSQSAQHEGVGVRAVAGVGLICFVTTAVLSIGGSALGIVIPGITAPYYGLALTIVALPFDLCLFGTASLLIRRQHQVAAASATRVASAPA